MRILFTGCVESSFRLLEKLIQEGKDVAGVITKRESAFNDDFHDLYPLCEKHGIPCHYTGNINDPDSMAFIKELRPDLGFCFGWSQLLGEEVLRLFPRGVVGFHPAPLPHNRGRHPLIWTLALGLEETASTFFMMNAGADEGDIISQKRITVSYEDDAGTLYDKVMRTAIQQEIEILEDFENGAVHATAQNRSEGNAWRRRNRADGEIDWRMSGRSIYNLVRSLAAPYAGAHFIWKGNEYKVWKAEEADTAGLENLEPGKVIAREADGSLVIKAGEGGIRLTGYEGKDLLIQSGDYIQ